MPDYRLYFLEGGHVVFAAEFIAKDDAEALPLADERRDHRAMELWNLNRVVAKYPAREEA